jgi:hypothetical protein
MESLGCLIGLAVLGALLSIVVNAEPRESAAYHMAQGMLLVVLVGAGVLATVSALAPVRTLAAQLLSN